VGCYPTSSNTASFGKLVENCFSNAFGIALTFQRDLDREPRHDEHGWVLPIDQPFCFQNLIERPRDDRNIVGREYSLNFQERPNRHDLPQQTRPRSW
jgi:hypothetical protein